MKIDIHVDRPVDRGDARDSSRPLENKEGVFALLDEDDLSETEKARLDAAQQSPKRALPRRNWLPQDITKYLTKLYGQLKRPGANN